MPRIYTYKGIYLPDLLEAHLDHVPNQLHEYILLVFPACLQDPSTWVLTFSLSCVSVRFFHAEIHAHVSLGHSCMRGMPDANRILIRIYVNVLCAFMRI